MLNFKTQALRSSKSIVDKFFPVDSYINYHNRIELLKDLRETMLEGFDVKRIEKALEILKLYEDGEL